MYKISFYARQRYSQIILLIAALFLVLVASLIIQQRNTAPLEENLISLKNEMTTGDVFIIDPNVDCGSDEDWDYLIHKHFPNTPLTFVEKPEDYRRIWYVYAENQQNNLIQKAVTAGRIPGLIVGLPDCLFQLFEGPPDPVGILFEHGMRFHGVDILKKGRIWSAPPVLHEGETVSFRLWWTVDRALEADYGIGTYILKDGEQYAQLENLPQVIYPAAAFGQTSQWIPNQYYIEEREMTLKFPTPRSNYSLFLSVYLGDVDDPLFISESDENLLRIKVIRVMAW